MSLTLLDIVQDVLSDMTADEVNSITDTVESEQVAQIVKSTYREMLANRNWPHTRRIVNVSSFSDTEKPTHLSINDSIKEVVSFSYNNIKQGETRKRYETLDWLEPEEFLRYTNNRNNDSSNVVVVSDPSGVELLIINNKPPEYYTSFNDKDLVLDSYQSEVESTIQQSKTQMLAYINLPDLELVDSAVPDLPEESFPALLEEVKSRAMFRLKQVNDIKAEQSARSQQRWNARKAWRVSGGIRFPNYGRGSGRRNKDSTFRKND